MAANPMQVEFVFVHSYRSDAPNWRAVMQGDAMKLGGTGALFAASEVPHSTAGAAGVMISEPSDLTARDGGQNALANMGVSCKAAPDDDVETTE